MPVYTYRREDGTIFDHRQKFTDDPLEICPTTGQRVIRVVHAPGIIFKGSGFYVTDSKKANNVTTSKNNGIESESKSDTDIKTDTTADTKTETKSEKTEKKQGTKAESAAD